MSTLELARQAALDRFFSYPKDMGTQRVFSSHKLAKELSGEACSAILAELMRLHREGK